MTWEVLTHTAARRKPPAAIVRCEVPIDEVFHEPFLSHSPIDHEVFGQETRHYHSTCEQIRTGSIVVRKGDQDDSLGPKRRWGDTNDLEFEERTTYTYYAYLQDCQSSKILVGVGTGE